MRSERLRAVVWLCAPVLVLLSWPGCGKQKTENKEQRSLIDENAAPTLEHIQEQIENRRYRAYGWMRLGYFDDALVEIREAASLLQSALLQFPEQEGQRIKLPHPVTLQRDAEAVRLRADVYRQVVERFQLPEGTLSDFRLIRDSEARRDAYWCVTYSVAPDDLTRRKAATNPAFYYNNAHVPGARAFVATYTPAESVDEKPARTALDQLPAGYAPYVDSPPASRSSWMTAVRLMGDTDAESGKLSMGAAILRDGRILKFIGGPCEGNAIALKDGQTAARTLAYGPYNDVFALADSQDGVVLAYYGPQQFRGEVRFAGNQIVEWTQKGERGRPDQVLFRASDRTVIADRDLAKKLVGWYLLRHNMDETEHLISDSFSFTRSWPIVYTTISPSGGISPDALEFDEEARQWKARYGDPETLYVAGTVVYITLDEYGHLVSGEVITVPD